MCVTVGSMDGLTCLAQVVTSTRTRTSPVWSYCESCGFGRTGDSGLRITLPDWSGNSSQCGATCGAVTESRNRRLIKVPVKFDEGEESEKPSYDETKHYLIKEDERSLCAWPRTRVLSCCLLFCFVLRWRCRRLPPVLRFQNLHQFFKSKQSEEFSHPCIDQNGVF